MKSRYRLATLAMAMMAFAISGCSGDSSTGPNLTGDAATFTSKVATEWFRLSYDRVRAESYSPPRASRAFGYAGVSLYESVVAGMPSYQSLAGHLNGLSTLPKATDFPYHWPTVANTALATVMRGLFEGATEATSDAINDLEADFNAEFDALDLEAEVTARSLAYGQAIGLAILEWSRRDGYATLHNCSGYTPSGELGRWEPTPPAFAPALEPCWGDMRTFVIPSGATCDPGPPPLYSEEEDSPFMIEAVEVYETASDLTPEEVTIAQFWADNPGQTGTPPGHSIMILTQVLESEDMDLEIAAEAYAKVGMAVADAFIACWWTKFEYDLVRPVTCIQDLLDADWLPPVVTPPFPEYSSGHSTQSGAAAEVLTGLFGDITFTDHTHDARGFDPRTFDSFYEFADEAAISRLYGGIHYRSAIELGVDQGVCIGEQVNALPFKKAVVSR